MLPSRSSSPVHHFLDRPPTHAPTRLRHALRHLLESRLNGRPCPLRHRALRLDARPGNGHCQRVPLHMSLTRPSRGIWLKLLASLEDVDRKPENVWMRNPRWGDVIWASFHRPVNEPPRDGNNDIRSHSYEPVKRTGQVGMTQRFLFDVPLHVDDILYILVPHSGRSGLRISNHTCRYVRQSPHRVQDLVRAQGKGHVGMRWQCTVQKLWPRKMSLE